MKKIMNKKVLLPIIALGFAVTLSLALYFDVYGILMCTGRFASVSPKTIQLDGYALSGRSCGSKKPTVIIEAGLNVKKEQYYDLQKRIFPHAEVITYDHAGIGESTISGNPRTLPFYVQELKAMLAQEQLEPPYILIGHSLGGHIIRYFTYLYPNEVAGLIFLDHPHEDWFRHIRANWPIEEQTEYFKWWNPEITSQDQIYSIEKVEYENNCELLRGIVIPSNIPVLMFTGDNARHFRNDNIGRMEDRFAYAKLQLSLIYRVKNAKQIIDWETGHWPQASKPEEVAREINEFIDKVQQTM